MTSFIPCGVWEAVDILDGLMKNRSMIQPDTLHADTHGQSEPVFGLCRLLGIKQMPRMRNIGGVTFYRPAASSRYRHIDALFRAEIDWDLIAMHARDVFQVVLSIQARRVTPSMLLRKLARTTGAACSPGRSARSAASNAHCCCCDSLPTRTSGGRSAPRP